MKSLAWIFLILSNVALAGIFDDLKDLEGKAIVYAGEFETVDCPYGGKYDCNKFPKNMLRAKSKIDTCIATSTYNSCSYSCKGLIAVGNVGRPEVFLFENSLGNDLKKYSFESYKCPSAY